MILIYRHGAVCHLLSFPTRRSSDLTEQQTRSNKVAEGSVANWQVWHWQACDLCPRWPSNAYQKERRQVLLDRKSTRLNSSHDYISYAVFCLKKKIDVI